ncbi:hypothetical protein TNCV_3916221 [Trichonephila clavipes]|nr:hypothetical protein TNCV_3916221 [Trichonephila clavipes]
MVLVKEDNLPPLQWSLGRVVQVFPGDDGAVRVVDVKTQRGQFRRPITKYFVKESLGCAATPTAKDAMNDTALEAKIITKCFKMPVEECGIFVDGRDT